MFSRGTRFEETKPIDVPGPNAYNLKDSEETHKRGAFHEKTDRFSKEQASDVLDPSSSSTTETKRILNKSSALTKNPHLSDRYAALQRKVEELDRVHQDAKKSHQLEVERLKLDLSRYQRTHAEHAERLEKQKKHSEILESRIQDLKKAGVMDQTEIKELKSKLKMAQRSQLQSKPSGTDALRKNLQTLESRKRDELCEKDKRIAELEKTLTMERKRRETIEARVKDLSGKGKDEPIAVRSTAHSLERAAKSAQEEATKARAMLIELQAQSNTEKKVLEENVERQSTLLAIAAEEYGRLVSSTVSKENHSRVSDENVSLQLQTYRLRRKLANSDGQVVELAHYLRRVQDDNASLRCELSELSNYLSSFPLATPSITHASFDDLFSLFDKVSTDELDNARSLQEIDYRTGTLSSECAGVSLRNMLSVYSEAELEMRQISCRLDAIQDEKKLSEEHLLSLMKSVEEKAKQDVAALATELQKEQDNTHHLNSTTQKLRQAEDGLRAEIDMLTAELTEAERFQEAFYSLSDEVGTLVAKNQLAEDEANRLSKMNADILGHHNPGQKIMYLDKIRQELAETKQKLLIANRQQEAVSTANAELQNELDMYASVIVPPEKRVRSKMTRLTRKGGTPRPALASLNQDVVLEQSPVEGIVRKIPSTPSMVDKTVIEVTVMDDTLTMGQILGELPGNETDLAHQSILDYIPTDEMTLDEIM